MEGNNVACILKLNQEHYYSYYYYFVLIYTSNINLNCMGIGELNPYITGLPARLALGLTI